MKVYRFILMLAGGLLTINLLAQETPAPLSLQNCIDIALENNVTINTYRNLEKIAQHNVKASYSNILPAVDFSTSGSKTKTGESVFLGNVQVGFDTTTNEAIIVQGLVTQPARERDNFNANLTVGQNLFDGGNWWNSIRQSKAQREVAKYDLLARTNETLRVVAQGYFDLLKQEKLLEVNDLAVQRSQDNLDRTQQMFEIGSVAKVDVFRARVNLGNDKISDITQRNTVQQSRQTLNIAMGRDPYTELEIVKEFKFNFQLPPLEELIQIAYENNPDLRRQEMDIRSTELNVALAKSVFLPSISAFFTYDRISSDKFRRLYSNFDQNWETRYGIRLTYNLFNGFRDQVNVQNTKIQLKNARLNLEDFERNLKSSITTLYDRYSDLQEIVEINRENLEAAREEYRLATERYRLGSGTSLDVRESQVNLTEAERILVVAEYDLIITYAELQETIGRILPALEF